MSNSKCAGAQLWNSQTGFPDWVPDWVQVKEKTLYTTTCDKDETLGLKSHLKQFTTGCLLTLGLS